MKNNPGRNARVVLLSRVSVLFCFLSFLCSCRDTALPNTARPLPFCDSFEVHGIDIGQQVQNFHYLNPTTLFSYNFSTSELVYFECTSPQKPVYVPVRRYPIETGFMSALFTGEDHRQYFISRDHQLSVYFPQNPQCQQRLQIDHHFPYLGDAFGILPSHTAPGLMKGDTLITFYAHQSFEYYNMQFHENSIAEFKLEQEKARFLGSYLPRPAGLSRQYAPFAKYCLQGNVLHLVYPGIDTIYSYDRHTKKTTTNAIDNANFVAPKKWDIHKVLQADYAAYFEAYTRENFSYEAFHYNPLTRHYLLFYSPATKTEPVKTSAPPLEKPLMVLVLDEHFRQVQLYSVPGNAMVNCTSCFYLPGKGFAWPRFQGPDKFQKTRFYVFNL